MASAGGSIRALLRSAIGAAASPGVPRLDAELLLASVLQCGREHLYANPGELVAPGPARDFSLLLHQRRLGIPLAYLTGEREFWSLPLLVSRDTLVPRPETELLVGLALEALPGDPAGEVLDLGTGCGAIALAIASERPRTAVTAADLSAEALAMAARNVQRLALDNVRLLRSDWFGAMQGRRFHVIVSNPPYVHGHDPRLSGELRFEPRLALDGGHGGLDCIRRIVSAAGGHLERHGVLLVEHGHDQGRLVRELFGLAGFRQVRTDPDLAGLDRVTIGLAP